MREESQSENRYPQKSAARPKRRFEMWLGIARITLREPIKRIAGHVAILAIIVAGIWAARMGFGIISVTTEHAGEAVEAQPTQNVSVPEVVELPSFAAGGPLLEHEITRTADIHTILRDRPRMDIVKYVVQPGDSVFGIAEKFSLKPESVLWANLDVLGDDPHRLSPGQELNVPPVDGVLHTWSTGEGLSAIAKFYGVSAQDVIEWPGNHLDPDIDLSDPPIEAGTLLVIPDGKREIVTWSAPRITRSNPAVAKIYGPGACGEVYDGPVGTSTFIWPTPLHYLSGYDYSSVHEAIDIAGSTGHAIFASNSGVVVYSGWNNYGYGYVIVIDHGNGWQTLYAHLSAINVGCGQAVFQGQVIGAMGSTGNSTGSHLHFEIMNDEYGRVNPWNYLP